MINIERTKDLNVFMSFLRGKGVERLCMGSSPTKIQDKQIEESLKDDHNQILIIKDGEKKVGWVAFVFLGGTAYSIHVCLRTIGRKTRDAIALALKYMKIVEHASHIYAVYPKDREAVARLANHLGFQEDQVAFKHLAYPSFKPLICQRLDLI